MFGVAKTVHDSITALSFADEVRQVSKNISSFVQKVLLLLRIFKKEIISKNNMSFLVIMMTVVENFSINNNNILD
jgi:hypothetical protein